MRVGRNQQDARCYAAEGMSAALAPARTLGSILERAPAGRLFDAIFTLADVSAKAPPTRDAKVQARR